MFRPMPYFYLDLIALDAVNDVQGELRRKAEDEAKKPRTR